MDQRVNKVAITGPFADVNFGDYAMLINNIYDLNIKDITLFSYDCNFLNMLRNDYLVKYNIDIVDVKLRDNFKMYFENHRKMVPFELLVLIDNYEEIVEKIQDIDVLIVNGGGYLNGLWSMPHRIERLAKIIAPILVANQLNKRIYFTANSFGPFGEDVGFFACLFNILNKNINFYCRDNLYSPMWLRQIGVDNSRIKYLPDDLFSINPGLLKLKTNVNIEAEEYIVMENYLPIDFIEENVDVFKNFSKKIYKKYGLNIVFLPFNIKQGGMKQAKYLQSVLKHFEYYDTESKGYLPIQDAVQIIKGARMVVSNRYHTLVLALSCGVPFVNVLKDVMGDKRYYYNKSLGMMREVLKGTKFDERLYLKLDYLEALSFIADNFETLLSKQTKNYNLQYLYNKKRLAAIRQNFFDEILSMRFEGVEKTLDVD